jgi:hypothetical protein
MKRFILGVAAVLALVVGAAPAQAGHFRVRVTRHYYRTSGVRFAGGYYYAGSGHRHWTRTVYSRQYGRTVYWDPGLRLWYYWDGGAGRYYPVSYLQ